MSSFSDEKEVVMQKDPKRLRTTITPEQLEYLYQQYLFDSSPSRKVIEQISEVVGLKKRVVQVGGLSGHNNLVFARTADSFFCASSYLFAPNAEKRFQSCVEELVSEPASCLLMLPTQNTTTNPAGKLP